MIRILFLLLLVIPLPDDCCMPDPPKIIVPRPPPLIPQYVGIGESLTSGSQSSGGEGSVNSYPGVVATLRSQTYGQTVINMGVSGIGIDSLPEPEAFIAPTQPNIDGVMEGINDLFNALTTSAVLFPKLQTYINARLAKGKRVIAATLTKVGGAPGSISSAQTQRTLYNTAIRNAYSGGAVPGVTLCDVAADSLIGDAGDTNGAHFSADHYHLSDLGYARLAALMNACIDSSWMAPITPAIADGAALLRSGTKINGWFRPDWSQRSTVKSEAYTLHNFSARQCFLRYLVENDQDDPGAHTQCNRIDNVLNARSCIRLPGDQSDKLAYYTSTTPISSFVSSTSVMIWALISATAIVGTSTVNPHFNDAIIGTGGGFGCGLSIRAEGAGTNKWAQGWTDDGSKKIVEALISLATPTAIFFRLTSGQIALKIGTQGSWSTPVASGAIGDLTGALRLGKFGDHCFQGDFFDGGIGQYDATDEANIGAYIRARYGSSL